MERFASLCMAEGVASLKKLMDSRCLMFNPSWSRLRVRIYGLGWSGFASGALWRALRGWEGLKAAVFPSSLDLGLGVDGFLSPEPPRFILLLVARCGEPKRMEGLNSGGAVFFFRLKGFGFSHRGLSCGDLVRLFFLRERERVNCGSPRREARARPTSGYGQGIIVVDIGTRSNISTGSSSQSAGVLSIGKKC